MNLLQFQEAKLGALLLCLIANQARADQIYITAEGAKHLDEIKRALAPAPMFTDQSGQKYFYGLATAAHPSPDPVASRLTEDGKPLWTIVAFGPDGAGRSETPARLSEHWIHVKHEWDTMLDMRLLFSNRDQVSETDIGSQRFRNLVLRAMDPQGHYRMRPNGDESNTFPISAGGDPHELTEGAIIHLLRGTWKQGADLASSLELWRQEKRLPVATHPHYVGHLLLTGNVNQFAQQLLLLSARQRRYLVYEPQIDLAAESMLQALSRIIDWVPSNERMAELASERRYSPDSFALNMQGSIERALFQPIYAAQPGQADQNDDMEIFRIVEELRGQPLPARPEQLKATLQQRIDQLQMNPQTFRSSNPDQGLLRVDNSELAAVAMDVIRAEKSWLESGGKSVAKDIFDQQVIRTRSRDLLDMLAGYGEQPDYPDPRKLDRVSLRGKALSLMVHFIDPPPAADQVTQQQRQRVARANRDHLYGRLHESRYKSRYGQNAIIRETFNQAGWVLTERGKRMIEDLFQRAQDCALGIKDRQERLADQTTRPKLRVRFSVELPQQKQELADRFQTLLAIHQLQESDDPRERQVANYLAPYFQRARQQADGGRVSKETAERLRFFLQLWDATASN